MSCPSSWRLVSAETEPDAAEDRDPKEPEDAPKEDPDDPKEEVWREVVVVDDDWRAARASATVV